MFFSRVCRVWQTISLRFTTALETGESRALLPSRARPFKPRLEHLEDRRLLNAGDLDPTFGQGGLVITQATGTNVTRTAVAIQQDGKIVVVTTAFQNTPAIFRYNTDGSLDKTFGVNGEVSTDFGHLAASLSTVAIQADGRIVVGGWVDDSIHGASNVMVARLNSDGSLDATFGTGGVDLPQVNNNVPTSATDLIVQKDAKIVVAVQEIFVPPTVIRLNSDGTMDQTFQFGGRVELFSSVDQVLEQTDGKILVSGGNSYNGQPLTSLVIRVNSDGSLDPTWSGANVGSFLTTMALQTDGKLLTTDEVSALPDSLTVDRFNVDGTPDAGFGVGGKDTVIWRGLSNAQTLAVLVQSDGKIILVGSNAPPNAPTQAVVVARLNADGSRDVTFGTNGLSVTDFPTGTVMPSGAVLQSDGKVVVASATSQSNSGSFAAVALARYQVSPPSNVSVNQLFIAQVYLDLLQRSADPGGLSAWTNLLNQGASRVQVVLDIENTSEYRTLEIQGLYSTVFGRAADPNGLQAWVAFLAEGHSISQVEAYFISSPEYLSHLSSLTSNSFTTAVYQTVLSRAPDAAGLQAWSQALANGASYYAVASAIIHSAESGQDQVEAMYRKYLLRNADPGGMAAFTNFLLQGGTPEAALAIIVGSDEYFTQV